MEVGHKTEEEFEKFYESDCKRCGSTSCIVRGGWKNPCFINWVDEDIIIKKENKND